MRETYEFLRDSEIFYIATIDEDGNPRVRPFGALAFVNNKLYMVTSNEKKVYKQLINNSQFKYSQIMKSKNCLRRQNPAVLIFCSSLHPL